jgi:type VI secretion system protein ImpH
VPAHQRSALGVANCTLGGTAPLGCELRAATTTFGVAVGPLELADYLAFLPDGERRRQLTALIDRCNGDLLDCEITVAIEPAAIVPCRLGDGGDAPAGRLGASTWLGPDSPRLAGDLGAATTRSLHCATDPMVA